MKGDNLKNKYNNEFKFSSMVFLYSVCIKCFYKQYKHFFLIIRVIKELIMGIPSYFSYVLRNHGGVLCRYANLIQNQTQFERLYMDCNSILYDCYREVYGSNRESLLDSNELEKKLLEKVCEKIAEYIRQISPSDIVYIAFDGVAPMAKMEQQRTRRYKSWFETALQHQIEGKDPINPLKTTSMFTPGTLFMEQLSSIIKQKFLYQEKAFSVRKIIVATPDEPGEGEHKLYAHMREDPCEKPCAVYGLDADLIMLGLFHLTHCPEIYIFRESPQFSKFLLEKTENEGVHEDEPLFIDVAKLARSIAHDMHCSAPDLHRMYDYVFMCFLLGNDFLPHFPSLNIRTGGIQILMDVYRAHIGNTPERFLLSKSKTPAIIWKEVARFIGELAKIEHMGFCQEYATRQRWDEKPAMIQPKKTIKEKMDLFINTPMLYRQEEKYINPHEDGWEKRYYETLFCSTTIKDISPSKISINYLEGLEWVTQYYLYGKVDWIWKYEYHYPPLLKDLAPKIPHLSTTFLPTRKSEPVSSLKQLAYVLPPIYHHLLPSKIAKQIEQYHTGLQKKNEELPTLQFQWAFCRYFWESHIILPSMPLETLSFHEA